MRMLKFTLIFCMAMMLVIGCASKTEMESDTAASSADSGSKMNKADTMTTAAYQEVTLNVDGMMCGACESKVSTALTSLPGVISADASSSDGKVVVKLEEGKATSTQLADAVKGAGFAAKAN